jgi:hypothetical protein
LQCPNQNLLNPSNFKKTGTEQLAVLPISDKTMCLKSKRKRKKEKTPNRFSYYHLAPKKQ